jgi:hypothetical protein
LFHAASGWLRFRTSDSRVLGFGNEGTVCVADGFVEKHFHPGALADGTVEWLRHTLHRVSPWLPEPEWHRDEAGWVCRYPYRPTRAADTITLDQARDFLAFCLDRGLACKGIKRQNFRVDMNGHLTMVDVGNDIMPLEASYFRDSAARLYAISALDWPDGELRRRPSCRRQEDVLAELPGFEPFYRDLLTQHAQRQWATATVPAHPAVLPRSDDVTLLI